jgi:transposase
MPKRIDFHLKPEDLKQIEQAIQSASEPEVRQRAIAIRLLHLGQSPDQVAQVVLVTANTIYDWHKRWREQGLAGLRDRQRSGRPSKADSAYIALLEELLQTDPAALGLPFTIWTIQQLRLYLHEQTRILLSYTRFRSLLSRLGYRWKQPKHDLSHLQDTSAQAVAEEVLDWLKKTSRTLPVAKPSSSLWTKRP